MSFRNIQKFLLVYIPINANSINQQKWFLDNDLSARGFCARWKMVIFHTKKLPEKFYNQQRFQNYQIFNP